MLRLKIVFAHRAHARILAIDESAALPCPAWWRCSPPKTCRTIATGWSTPISPYSAMTSCASTAIASRSSSAKRKGRRRRRTRVARGVRGSSDRRRSARQSPVPRSRRRQVLMHQQIRRGDVARRLPAPASSSRAVHDAWQEHAYLQPDAGIAYYDRRSAGRGNRRTVAARRSHADRRDARLPEDRAGRHRYAKIGGAFGGREDMSVQSLVALATWVLKRPTAIRWSREESIIGHHKRHPYLHHGEVGRRSATARSPPSRRR